MPVDNAACRKLFDSGKSLDDVLRFLRNDGASRIECMRVLVDVRGLTLAEAKEAVHFSQTWSDLKESTDRFHKEMAEALGVLSELDNKKK